VKNRSRNPKRGKEPHLKFGVGGGVLKSSNKGEVFTKRRGVRTSGNRKTTEEEGENIYNKGGVKGNRGMTKTKSLGRIEKGVSNALWEGGSPRGEGLKKGAKPPLLQPDRPQGKSKLNKKT